MGCHCLLRNFIRVPYKSTIPNYRIPKVILKTQMTIVAFFLLMIVLYIEFCSSHLKCIQIQRLRMYIGEGNGTPLQYSCLENPMGGGAWWAAVHGVAKSRTRLSYFTFTFHFHALEKEMAMHSSVLAWRIPGTGESGGLPSLGSHRVRHD